MPISYQPRKGKAEATPMSSVIIEGDKICVGFSLRMKRLIWPWSLKLETAMV